MTGTECFEENGSTLIFSGCYQKPYASYALTVFSPQNNGYIKNETQIDERFYSAEEIAFMTRDMSLTKIRTISFRDRKIYIYRKGFHECATL